MSACDVGATSTRPITGKENNVHAVDAVGNIASRHVPVLVASLLIFLGVLAAAPVHASAAVEWTVEPNVAPTNLPPGGQGGLSLALGNAGDSQATGWPTVEFQLPTGVTLQTTNPSEAWACTGVGDPQTITCDNFGFAFLPDFWPVEGQYAMAAEPLSVILSVAPDAPEGTFDLPITLSGAGAADSVIHVGTLRVGEDQLPFGITPDTFEAGAFDEAGNDYTQAGGHPYVARTSFETTTRFVEPSEQSPWAAIIQQEGRLKDAIVDLPAGFVGDPTAVPACDNPSMVWAGTCPAASQVGVATFDHPSAWNLRMSGVFNVVPESNAPAQFAFQAPTGPVLLTPVLRSDGDWGLSVHSKSASEGTTLRGVSVALWGVPADPSHDPQRCSQPSIVGGKCVGHDSLGNPPGQAGATDPRTSSAPLKPFLTNPTECTGDPELISIHMSDWNDPASYEADGDPNLGDSRWASATAAAPPISGCSQLGFDPEITVTPTTSAPDSPTGLDFTLRVPQTDNPNGLATAHLRNTTVTLPEGMTVNPSSAEGLAACSSAEIGLVSKAPLRFTKLAPSCPPASKIGSVEVDTPLLDDPLTGDVFLASQKDNPFGSLLAMYIVVRGPGLLVKLAGHVEADPDTGRLSTTVLDNPQVPFETLRLRLKGGERAPLATPSTCGPQTVTAHLSSWAGHDISVADSFEIDCPGLSGFAPTVAAGAISPVGGGFSPFLLRIARGDREQLLSGVTVDLPQGLLAKLRGVPPCPSDRAAAGTCHAASRIGTAVAGAGVGTHPFFTAPQHGSVYLTSGYKGAPYGLATVVRAIAGPFDLGEVIVRQALYVDRATARVKVVSDPLPRILEGIPLRLRSVEVTTDRPGFTRNPTSCSEKQVRTRLTSTLGASHTAVNRFQVGDCQSLSFKPRLTLRLTGKRQRRTGAHPGIRATVTQAAGEAGIRQAVVRLPKALALDESNARALCEYVDGVRDDLERACPAGSIVGRARAVSPLLERPLVGNVYFVKNVRRDPRTGRAIRTLPMIVAALRGEIAINLKGASSVRGGRLVSTFQSVPDAPVSRFNLNITGGRNGILLVTRTRRGEIDICRGRQTAVSGMTGHNGKRRGRLIDVQAPCKPARTTK
jgi:hypothetical protein